MSTALAPAPSTATVVPADRIARQRARHDREGIEAAHRIVTEICDTATGPADLLRRLGEAEKRVADGPAPQVFKDAFARTVIEMSEGQF